MAAITRAEALPYVAWIVDDALSGREPGAAGIPANATLVGWQCGFEPLFVAVHSYLPDTTVDSGDAVDIARDWLAERGWFTDPAAENEPDHVIPAGESTHD